MASNEQNRRSITDAAGLSMAAGLFAIVVGAGSHPHLRATQKFPLNKLDLEPGQTPTRKRKRGGK